MMCYRDLQRVSECEMQCRSRTIMSRARSPSPIPKLGVRAASKYPPLNAVAASSSLWAVSDTDAAARALLVTSWFLVMPA